MTSTELLTPSRRAPAVSRSEWWAVGALTAALLAVTAFWSILAPIYDAPDEPLHMNSAIRLAEGWDWPEPGDARLQNMVSAAREEAALAAPLRSTFAELREAHPGDGGLDQMTQHPPLYYAYAGTVLRAIDFLDVRADRALTVVRLAGLLFVLPLPFLVWDSVRRITRSPRAAVVGASSLLAVPQLAHIMGSVSNDGLTVVLASTVVWLGVRVMTGDARWPVTIGMGLALGLALMTKGTALPLVFYAATVLLVWPRRLSAGQRLVRAAVAMAVALGGGWWWVRNLLVHGALQPPALIYPSAEWDAGTGPDIFYFAERVWNQVSISFWGNFGWLNNPLSTIITDTLTVLSLAVIAGYAFRRSSARWQMVVLAGLPILFLVALLSQAWPGYVRTQLPAGLQGRYFFVVIVPLIVLSAVAWRRLVAASERRVTGAVMIAVFGAMGLTGILVNLHAAYSDGAEWLDRTPVGSSLAPMAAVMTAVVGLAALVTAARFVLVREPHALVRRGTSPRPGD